jgi:hypothetical protein
MVAITWGAARAGSSYSPRHRALRRRVRPRLLLAAVLMGLVLVIAVPAAAGSAAQGDEGASIKPGPLPDLAHGLIYTGFGALTVSLIGSALVAYRRRQY